MEYRKKGMGIYNMKEVKTNTLWNKFIFWKQYFWCKFIHRRIMTCCDLDVKIIYCAKCNWIFVWEDNSEKGVNSDKIS